MLCGAAPNYYLRMLFDSPRFISLGIIIARRPLSGLILNIDLCLSMIVVLVFGPGSETAFHMLRLSGFAFRSSKSLKGRPQHGYKRPSYPSNQMQSLYHGGRRIFHIAQF